MNIVFISSAGDSYHIAKVIYRFSRIPSPSHPIYRQDSGVIPSSNMLLKNELVQFSFGHDSVSDVESGILPLRGTVDVEFIKGPIVELTSDFKLERAKRVSYTFKTIANGMSIVV